MSQKLLPLGSVVYLQEGTEKVMVVGRGVVYHDEETNAELREVDFALDHIRV